MINFQLQRYGENSDGTILKNECFTVGTCRVPNETRLARSRYSATAQQRKKKKDFFFVFRSVFTIFAPDKLLGSKK